MFKLLQYDAVCWSVLECVGVCYSVLQCVAVCCSVLQGIAKTSCISHATGRCSNALRVLQCVAACCSVCVVHCGVLRCVAIHCNREVYFAQKGTPLVNLLKNLLDSHCTTL